MVYTYIGLHTYIVYIHRTSSYIHVRACLRRHPDLYTFFHPDLYTFLRSLHLLLLLHLEPNHQHTMQPRLMPPPRWAELLLGPYSRGVAAAEQERVFEDRDLEALRAACGGKVSRPE
jgi:hypothetical protein